MKSTLFILTIFIIVLTGCRHKSATTAQKEPVNTLDKLDGSTEAIEDSVKKANALALQAQFSRTVIPKAQTHPVDQHHLIDAADDPAIWYNELNPDESRVLGTDKKAGLALYNLEGKLIEFLAAGRVNNVDLRYNFPLNDRKIAVVAASERNENAIVLFKVNADSLRYIHTQPTLLDTNIIDDAYGCCMYYSRKREAYYTFVGGKNGNVQQWKLVSEKNTISLQNVRTISLNSQCEGMVADDESGTLFIAEEGNAIWKLSAEEDAGNEMTKLADSDSLNQNIAFDIEGLDIYYAGNGKGYLIASVQGNFSYAVFEKEGNNNYLGNFIIQSSINIDGAEETDGLAVSNIALGHNFPNGILVVQDGFNEENGLPKAQNFKFIDWKDVSTAYSPNLLVNPDYLWYQ
ncbi:MAG: phytase [Bacteroidales bacterium]|nr:phytase [Bacteroidales bacterium]